MTVLRIKMKMDLEIRGYSPITASFINKKLCYNGIIYQSLSRSCNKMRCGN